MTRNTDAFTVTFLEGLRRDIPRWKAELSIMDIPEDTDDAYLPTSEIRAWLEAGEDTLVRYDKRET